MENHMKNLSTPALFELSLKKEKSKLTSHGALSFTTGIHTGRTPNAKKIVWDNLSKDKVCWINNSKISEGEFNNYLKKFLFFKNNVPGVHLQEVSAVRDSKYSLDINVYTEFAKHAAVVRNLLIPKENGRKSRPWKFDVIQYLTSHTYETLVFL